MDLTENPVLCALGFSLKSDRDQNVTEIIGRNRKGKENTGKERMRDRLENGGDCL